MDVVDARGDVNLTRGAPESTRLPGIPLATPRPWRTHRGGAIGSPFRRVNTYPLSR
jgi:hypothetical protein